jgi:hypothetical protein
MAQRIRLDVPLPAHCLVIVLVICLLFPISVLLGAGRHGTGAVCRCAARPVVRRVLFLPFCFLPAFARFALIARFVSLALPVLSRPLGGALARHTSPVMRVPRRAIFEPHA